MILKKVRLIFFSLSTVCLVLIIVIAVLFTPQDTLIIFPQQENVSSEVWWPFANPETVINSFEVTSRKIECKYTLSSGFAFAGVGIFLERNYPFFDLSKYKRVTVKLSAPTAKHFGIIIQTFEMGVTQLKQNGDLSPLRSCETRKELLENTSTYSILLSELASPYWWINQYAIRGKELDPNPLKKAMVTQIFFNDTTSPGQRDEVEVYEVAFHKPSVWRWVFIIIGIVCWFLISRKLLKLNSPRPEIDEQEEDGRIKLLSDYKRISLKDNKQEDREIITSFISKHYNSSEISLRLLSSETGIATNRVKEIISHEYRMNFKECIIWLRLQEAKRLLVETDFTITEIAFELGFSSNSYFGSLFKKQEGITPKEYRDKHKPGK